MEEVFNEVKKYFIYTPDVVNYGAREHFKAHAQKVKNKKTFKDDCDGFALTCAHLLTEIYKPQDIFIVVCINEEKEGHLVAGVRVGGSIHILDNRSSHIYTILENRSYTWIKAMTLEHPGKWLKL